MHNPQRYSHCDDPPSDRQSDDAQILNRYALLLSLIDSDEYDQREEAFGRLARMSADADPAVRHAVRILLGHFTEDDHLNLILAEHPHYLTGPIDREMLAELVCKVHPKQYRGRDLPREATDAPAGSALKIEVMRARHAAGGGLWHPHDPTTTSGPALAYRKAGNSVDVRDGVLEDLEDEAA